ncbi:MAG: UDP-glucose 4-epimerase GalE [Pseudonocardiaceae bacterium]
MVSRNAMRVLVTGGAGFIGSHTCLELLQHGHQVVVFDDFSNSSPLSLDGVRRLAGRDLRCHEGDVRDRSTLAELFQAYEVDAVIHFAAKKAVGESMDVPLNYYDVNVGGTAALLSAMHEHGVHQLVFSSSCSIYGTADGGLLTEDAPARPTNPYARSKWMAEQMMADGCARYPDFRVLALRYFNPVGAHPSSEIGEDPCGVPTNVMPYIAQVAIGRRQQLSIFGNDWGTPDGTAVRDYVHVLDVAAGHRLALDHLADRPGMEVFNLGSGTGVSVLQLVAAFRAACRVDIPYRVAPRRPGDVAELVADSRRIRRAWGWRPTRDLYTACRDACRFQRRHPDGYRCPP